MGGLCRGVDARERGVMAVDQTTLAQLVTRYMRDMMAMPEPLEDQEQNWFLAHMMECARRAIDADRMSELLVPASVDAAKTRPVRAQVDDGNEVF